ncbi:MarR family transcriptional regulator [Brachybacterium huguangmaarense]|uniref:MarR family transcriptional regulator n=1 Tax=Brachybacterium huguangmaarense TaxID=1652028 RepID=A0ABY6G3T2_9MICO|nr:sugar-binding domain-containing protein [Brachybacterium huguangmaarense]UYG17777.1 MarR family transcriptional regulator [Brachybacterium huguangmaarense]
MPAARDTATVVQAARLYYDEGLSQSEVARELGLSRSNVSRILTRARERGIVEITIHDPDAPPVRDPALETAIEVAFSVSCAVVVAAGRASGLDAAARAAAALVHDRAPAVRSIGVSWGQTVQRTVAQLEPQRLRPAPRVLPLVGGLSMLDQTESGDSVQRLLAARLGARPEPLFAPALVESAAASATLQREPSIARVLAAAAGVELALVGIGSMGLHSSPHLLEGMGLTEAESDRVRAQEGAGDVCGRFVDAHGAPLGPPTSERVIAVTLEQLARIPEVVGVAAGAEKAPGVRGVLRTGVLDTVVLDAALARAVLARA